MVEVLLAAVASLALALAASLLRTRVGTKWFLAISVVVVTCLLGVARYFPLVAMHALAGRPYSFFRTQYLGYSLAVGAATMAVLAAVSLKPIARVAVTAVAIFCVAWGGTFVT